MKRTGILNRNLAGAVAALGHGHEVVVADAGLPLPATGPEVVDLSLVAGVPSFATVLRALVDDVVIEDWTLAREAEGGPVATWAADLGTAPEMISHEELKARLTHVRLIVRTGETTPFANVILRCGVMF